MERRPVLTRRDFVRSLAVSGTGAALLAGPAESQPPEFAISPVYVVRDIPVINPATNHHLGVDALLDVLGFHGRKFYQSATESLVSGPAGMIAPDDVVLVKVNAQWKYRGCTNSDVVRGVIQRVLDHPDGFSGEVVVFENGQDRGDLDCSTTHSAYPDATRHANAEDESHSFSYLVNTVFANAPVTEYLLDPVRSTFFSATEHTLQGYRREGGVSYPCFTSATGNRIELKDGLWGGSGHLDKLKLINIPVLKHHNGCGTTGALKHFYGILSMADGGLNRHYSQIGNHTADMWCNIKTPVLTILDCIWVSPGHLSGYPPSNTRRLDTLLAGFDPVALDFWSSKYVLYPAGGNPYHDPDQSSDLEAFLSQAMARINGVYGGVDGKPATMTESSMQVFEYSLSDFDGDGVRDVYEDTHGMNKFEPDSDSDGMPDGYELRYGLDPVVNDADADLDGDGFSNIAEFEAGSPPNDAGVTPETKLPAAGTFGKVVLGAAVLTGGLLAASKLAKDSHTPTAPSG